MPAHAGRPTWVGGRWSWALRRDTDMSLSLSLADVRALRNGLVTLLSPLEQPIAARWGAAILDALVPILGADQAFLGLPAADGIHLESFGARAEPAALAYEQHFWKLDTGVTKRRKQLGLQVYHRDMVYDRLELPRNELFNDWCRPYRLMDPLVMSCEGGVEPIPASMAFYHDSDGARQFGDRGIGLLGLLLPAFKAGVQIRARLGRYAAGLARTLDHLPDALMLCDRRGVAHQTPPLGRMLAEDPEAERVRGEMLRVGAACLTLVPPLAGGARQMLADPFRREIVSAHARYLARGILTTMGLPGTQMALVTLSRIGPRPLSDAALRARFALTPREVSVCRHLAKGLSNRHLAERLASAGPPPAVTPRACSGSSASTHARASPPKSASPRACYALWGVDSATELSWQVPHAVSKIVRQRCQRRGVELRRRLSRPRPRRRRPAPARLARGLQRPALDGAGRRPLALAAP
jgi:hypothetical protein